MVSRPGKRKRPLAPLRKRRPAEPPPVAAYMPAEFKHCDEYIDDPSQPPELRAFLGWARSPAHGMLLPEPHPRLFATYQGRRVRVTMASRFGDVGITHQLEVDHGYERRVSVADLMKFSAESGTDADPDTRFRG
jgi:hypothetical protein